MYLSNKELSAVVGGISGALITALAGICETIFEIGKAVGRNLRSLIK
ncbi:MAG: hypothetical protein ACLUFU_06035 [Bacilli bacterium]